MTIKDPFAAEAPDEPQTVEPAPAVIITPEPAPAVVGGKPTIYKIGDTGKIVLTFKEGTGYDASWIVVHAGTVAEADALLDQSFADLMAKTKRVAAHFRGGSAPSSGGSRASAPEGAKLPPSWFPAPPDPSWVYKTGFKNGKTWHAWAPAEKGGGEWQFHRQP